MPLLIKGEAPDFPKQTTAALTYYVRTDGLDTNTGLANTAGAAFKTIAKALSMIPLIVNHTVTINIAAGTYAENVLINGFSGAGSLVINPNVAAVSSSYNVQSVLANNCTIPVGVSGINATTTSANSFGANSCVDLELKFCSASASASASGVYLNSSKSYAYSCVFSNKVHAVYSGQNSDIFIWNCSGTGNTVALYAGEGGRISTTGVIPVGTTATATGNGGNISSGVINPWGDNTRSSRSAVVAWQSTAQSIVGSTYTKVLYQSESYDILGEYDASRFTAKQSGIYNISASLGVPSLPDATRVILLIRKNSTFDTRVHDFATGQTNDAMVAGSSNIDLNAGDYVEIFCYIGGANVTSSTVISYFNSVRVA